MRFAQWQTPEALSNLVDEVMNQIGSRDFFNQGGLAILRDAWTAAEFGQVRQATQVRLVTDTWPDFEIKIGGQIEQFEAVEADDPQRRRGDEYRNDTEEIEHDPVEDWIARAEQAPVWLDAACRKKSNKKYSARANLVVYLNLSEYGIRQKQVEKSFAAATATAKDSFDSVWILWKKRAYLIWQSSQGRRVQYPRYSEPLRRTDVGSRGGQLQRLP
jgi:hypothetical protein